MAIPTLKTTLKIAENLVGSRNSMASKGTGSSGGSTVIPTPIDAIVSSIGNSFRLPVQQFGNNRSITTKIGFYTHVDIYESRVWVPVFARNETVQCTGTIDDGAGNGSVAGNILTVTALSKGKLTPDVLLSGNSVTTGTIIVSQLTSTETNNRLGGRGTYQVSVTQARTSGTFTTSVFCDKLIDVENARIACAIDTTFQDKISGMSPREKYLFNSANFADYSRSTWNEATGYAKSDWKKHANKIPKGTRIGIFTTWANATVGKLPISLLGSSYVNRNEATLIDNTDHIDLDIAGSASSMPALDSARVGTSGMFTPAFLEIKTNLGEIVLIQIGTSVVEGVGADLETSPHASFGGPDNKGDIQGNLRGMKGYLSVGADNAQINSVNFGKATDKGVAFCSTEATKYLMEGVLGAAGTGGVTVADEHSINDYFNPVISHATNKYVRAGEMVYVSATNRCYLATQKGNLGGAPTDETGNEFTSGQAKLRYIGTYTDANQRTAAMIMCAKANIHRQIKALIPRARILSVPTIPGSTSTNNYLDLVNQTVKNAWGGPTTQRGYEVTMERSKPSWFMVDDIMDPNPFCESGATLGTYVTIGQETSLWHADGVNIALHTGNVVLNGTDGGSHPNNYGNLTMGQCVTVTKVKGP